MNFNKLRINEENTIRKVSLALIFLIIILLFHTNVVVGLKLSNFESYENYKVELILFYSDTCPHCHEELRFLDKLEQKYSESVRFIKYRVEDGGKVIEIWRDMCKLHGIERYFGSVPLTFIRMVGEDKGDYILGFDNENNTGRRIEEILQDYLRKSEMNLNTTINQTTLPFFMDISKYSLPIASIILGFIDGFNVCSLGALVIIISLVIGLKSRKHILLLGGMYILTTSIVYALLMFFWYNLFEFLGNYISKLEILVGIIGIIGAFYFFKEFYRFKKYGPSCEAPFGNKLLGKFSKKFSEMQKKGIGLALLAFSVFIFSLIITIVEFPCSAAVPLFYVSVLATKELRFIYEFFLMVIYIFFYMLDEIIIFLIAVFTLKIRFTSPKVTMWMYLFAGIILLVWGVSYLL
ncbi:MAG: thioredoxin family protein [Candidatus Aenigmatarchaeota archaeon]